MLEPRGQPRARLERGPTPHEVILFAVLMIAFVALYLYNIAPRPDGGRPRWWRWTLAAQVPLAVAPLPFVGCWKSAGVAFVWPAAIPSAIARMISEQERIASSLPGMM